MRSLAHVAVVLLQLAGCARAVAAAWQSPVTEPLLRRQLRVIKPQAGTCPEGCELESVSPGSCVFDGTSGGMLCKFCKASTGRVAAADGSCGCKPGFYLEAGECKLCPKGSYCLGGTADLSVPTACGDNLNTINLGTRESKDCVTTAGFSLGTVDGKLVAVACPANTFNSGKNRLTACVPCPAGLTTGGATQRVSISGCLLPPGWQSTSLYKAVRCPRGEYRAGDAAFSVSVRCSKCPTGTNTQFSTRTAITECKWVHPGWRWKSSVQSEEQQLLASAEPAERCPFHSYCPGGEEAAATADGSIPCPNGLWTKGYGAKFARNCSIPIGHYLSPITNAVTACDLGDASNAIARPGSYQPSWLSPSDAAAGACLPCGSGVLSEPVSAELAAIIPPGGGVPLAKVAGPSSSCYIRRGQGLVIDSSATRSTGALTFRGVTCSSGSYGISAKKNGLTRSRCKDCPFGTVTSSSSCTSPNQCPDPDTGGFYSIDACRYAAGAKCGNIRAASSGTYVSFMCTSSLKYDASKDQELIQGMNQTVASDTCCATAYATGATCANSNIACTGQTKLVNTDVVGLATSEAVTKCCKTVYAANTMCSTAPNGITCGDDQTLVDTAINGKTVLEAVDMCCKPNCKDVTCASGTAKNDTTPIPDGQAPASVCCNTCASYTCTNSKLTKSTTGPAAGQEPTDDICCAFPTGSNCDNVDGDSSTADPFSCGASPAAPKPAPGNIPLVNVLPSAASTACCVTSCSAHTCASGVKKTPVMNVDGIDPTQCCETCAGYSCTAPTALRSTLPQLNQGQGPTDELCCAYRSGATCGDADGPTLSAAGRLVCSGGGPITVDLTTTIGNESPAGAQTKCCTTTSSTCAGYSCPGGSVVKDPQLSAQMLTADLCCAYPDSAKCGDIDGSKSPATVPLVCSNGVPSNPATTTIAGQSPAHAQTTCCATYPDNASCGDVDGLAATTTDSLVCDDGNLVGSPESTPIAGRTPADAQSTCCTTTTTTTTSCQTHTCNSGELMSSPPSFSGTVTLTDAMCCNTCDSITCGAPTSQRLANNVWPRGTPSAAVCCGYPTGATCGDVDGPGSGTTSFSCATGPPIPASPTTPLAGVVASAAISKCCLTNYPAGATCSGIYGAGSSTAYSCSPADRTAATDNTPINDMAPAAASKACCTTSCSGVTCSSGVAKTGGLPGIVTADAATCCDTCASITCPNANEKLASSSWPMNTAPSAAVCCTCGAVQCPALTSRLLEADWPPGTPSADVCCIYAAGATCDDVDGPNNANTNPFGCSSTSQLVGNYAGLSINLATVGDARSTCCTA
uniref:Tyrosine-protein kinase ephrin type A/B receptor-like domain-containing protein n=1 Tax=Tetradesmus obliquus TaxID=3088 RepID=A0A383WFC8_TETOB